MFLRTGPIRQGPPERRTSVLRRVAASTTSKTCWIVGAGLGGRDYLTLKAVELIKRADVILHDDLGTQDALSFASEACEKINVGKRGSRTSITQPQIDQLLVQACTQVPGRRVVRLKGGDPAVFSRVSSEAAVLSAAGIKFELVPGVSSALAAPLLAGAPLTDVSRGGNAFAVVSGHDVAGTDWALLAGVPTLVILMAGRSLATLTDALLRHGGRAHDTPVLLVRSAGLPDQCVWRSTLGAIADDVRGESRLSPCVLTVGAVAALPAEWEGLVPPNDASTPGTAATPR